MMRLCPKCKSATLGPLGAGPEQADVVPPSRCTRCRGVWLPHEAVEEHVVPASVDEAKPVPSKADDQHGTCPRCRGLLVRARVDAEQPFHLDRCPVCRGIWFDGGEWAAVASTEWLNHLDDLWDPVWRKRVREEKAARRHLETLAQALGQEVLARLNAAIAALREHPMRSLGLSFLIEELRGPER